MEEQRPNQGEDEDCHIENLDEQPADERDPGNDSDERSEQEQVSEETQEPCSPSYYAHLLVVCVLHILKDFWTRD